MSGEVEVYHEHRFTVKNVRVIGNTIHASRICPSCGSEWIVKY